MKLQLMRAPEVTSAVGGLCLADENGVVLPHQIEVKTNTDTHSLPTVTVVFSLADIPIVDETAKTE